ncbi:MAG: ATP-binding protein [Candidatus Micrarchaeota archaeon]
MSIFINRESELQVLEERYKSNRADFLIIYGRRRVGKTELMKQFYKQKLHAYYICTKSDDVIQLKTIVRRTADSLNERAPEINSWDEFFLYLAEKVKNKRFILVIDEYPYLASANTAISSIFQTGWDEYLKNTKIFLILCGSSISVMEHELTSKSPLYGRRTGQLRIEPLLFEDSVKFFPKYNIRDKIYAYCILGNIPMYLLEFDGRTDIFSNISDKILRKDAILYEEPIFLLREELREPERYSRIFEVISTRGAKLNDIATKTGIEHHKLPKYLGTLIKLNYIEKISPITTKKPKSKQTLYLIKDNFFKFWYKYVYPYRSDIEGEDRKKVLDIIKSELNQYTSFIFEDVCKQILKKMCKRGMLPLVFSKIGKWWGCYRDANGRKEVDIDLTCLDEIKKEALFMECKWSDVKEKEAEKIIECLKEKAGFVEWERKKEFFGLFGKKIFGKENLRKQGFVILDLDDIADTLQIYKNKK